MKIRIAILTLCMILCGMVFPTTVSHAADMDPEIKVGHITDPEFRDAQIIEMAPSMARLTTKNINWTVPTKTRYYTPTIHKFKDEFIHVNVVLSHTGYAGIVNLDGTIYYVSGKNIAKAFPIYSEGYYQVIVQNNSATTKMTARGSYGY